MVTTIIETVVIIDLVVSMFIKTKKWPFNKKSVDETIKDDILTIEDK